MLTTVQRVECIWAIFREAQSIRHDVNTRQLAGTLVQVLEDMAQLPQLFVAFDLSNRCDVELLQLVPIIAPPAGPPPRGTAAEIVQRHLFGGRHRFRLVRYHDCRPLATLWIVPMTRSRRNPLKALFA